MAFVIGGRQTRQKPGLVFAGVKIVLGDKGRIGNIDIGPGLQAVLGHIRGNIGEQFVVQRFVRCAAVNER